MLLARILTVSVVLSFIFIVDSSAEETCTLMTTEWSNMEVRTVKLVRDDGETVTIRSRIADSARERAAGFQHICPEIIELSSILFIYKFPINSNFHMFNVHADLDIGFFSQKKELITVLRMTPQKIGSASASTYGPGKEFMYALETRAEFFSDNNLKPFHTVLEYP